MSKLPWGRGHDQADSESKWIELKSEFWLKLTLCDTSTGYIIIIIFYYGGGMVHKNTMLK